jgi:hypothetical protein
MCTCAGDKFRVRVDDDEGYAARTCISCDTTHLIFDSAEVLDDARPGDATCPCGGETFNAAAGFAPFDEGEIRWVYLGLRCVADGVLGCYADWKIDYVPSTQLFERI